jgi:hypothetical protein
MLLVTSDMDWRAKWDTPPDVIPHFIEASEVRRGAQLAILVFLSNARLKNGASDTVVDLHVKRPDGSISTNAADSPCLSGPYGGNPTNVLMCESSLMYSADATDPAGKWTVDVVLKDRHGGVEIPLHTSFQVLD